MARRQSRHIVVEEQDAAGVRLRGPGDQVEQRALAGAIRTDQAEDLAGSDLEAHVVDGGQGAEPFGCAIDDQHRLTGEGRTGAARSGCPCAGERRARARQVAVDHRHDAGAGVLQQDDEKHAEHHDLELRAVARECGKDILQDVLEQRDDGCADHGAGDVAGAADQRHQQQFDARTEVERRRAHVALHVRIKPAGQAGEQSGEDENG